MGRGVTESQAIWAIIAVIIGIDALWAQSIGIRIAVSLLAVSCVVLASGLGFVYANLRPDRRIAVLASTSAQLIAFSAAIATLVYLTATSRFPLVDRYLAAGDAAIGFDWLSSFTWIQNHPAIDLVLGLSYASFIPQTGILLVVLSGTMRLDRMREFVWLYVLTLLIVVPLSGLLPAESAWVYFGVTDRIDAYHLADFTAPAGRPNAGNPHGPSEWANHVPVFSRRASVNSDLRHQRNSIPVPAFTGVKRTGDCFDTIGRRALLCGHSSRSCVGAAGCFHFTVMAARNVRPTTNLSDYDPIT
jgi:hypothetical protein